MRAGAWPRDPARAWEHLKTGAGPRPPPEVPAPTPARECLRAPRVPPPSPLPPGPRRALAARGCCRGARPTWLPGGERAQPGGRELFSSRSRRLLPPRAARRRLFLRGGDRISPRPCDASRPGGAQPGPGPRAPGAAPARGCARKARCGARRGRSESAPSRPPSPQPERRLEEGAPRPTLFPAWLLAGRAAAPRPPWPPECPGSEVAAPEPGPPSERALR